MLAPAWVWTHTPSLQVYNVSGTYLSRWEQLIPTSLYKLFSCLSLVETTSFSRTDTLRDTTRLQRDRSFHALESSGWFCGRDDCSAPSSSRCVSSSAPPSNRSSLSCLPACCCRSLKERERRRIATIFLQQQRLESGRNAGTIKIYYSFNLSWKRLSRPLNYGNIPVCACGI